MQTLGDDAVAILEAAQRPNATIESVSDWTGIPADQVLLELETLKHTHGIQYIVEANDSVSVIISNAPQAVNQQEAAD